MTLSNEQTFRPSVEADSRTDDMLHIVTWENGVKEWSPFTAKEMDRRQNSLRQYMQSNHIDCALLTSYHGICYYSGFLYCRFGRNYGFLVDQQNATSISAGIDGGQPWRRTHGDNIIYTDWRRDSFFNAVKSLLKPDVKVIGLEFDHVTIDLRLQLESYFEGVSFVDIGQASMKMRLIKSDEEQTLIREGTRICNVGAKACIDAIGVGVPEYEIAMASTNAMIREIGKSFEFVELMDSWTWFQSGIMTDGAHNPVTNKRVASGDILSLNCFPMIFGYYTAIERTLFCESVSDAHLDYWQKNCEVMRVGSDLIQPGKKCSEIAHELNDLYRSWDLLKYRSFGYGHSFGVLSHYYGREAGVELREDVDTVLEPGMVVSMEPMIMIPEGQAGAGGYREHDIFIVGENGSENITNFAYGPDEMVIKN